MASEIRKEFRSYQVDDVGYEEIGKVRIEFETFLTYLENVCGKDSREMAIVRTKLEEASFFAIKSLSILRQKV